MTRNTQRAAPGRTQRARSVRPKSRDPYVHAAKAADSSVCDRCGVVGHGGRWYWGAPPFGEVRGGLCPACERIRDRAPAGTLKLSPEMREQRVEVERLLRSIEAAEREEHPLERLIAVGDRRGALWVSTTGIHLARRIASQLQRRFHHKPHVCFDRDHEVRFEWRV